MTIALIVGEKQQRNVNSMRKMWKEKVMTISHSKYEKKWTGRNVLYYDCTIGVSIQ